jgi:hypothetical protein
MTVRFRFGGRVHVDTGFEDSSWSGLVVDVNDKCVGLEVWFANSRKWVRFDMKRSYAEAVLQNGPLPKRERRPGNGWDVTSESQ